MAISLESRNSSLPRHCESPSPIIIVYQNTPRRCGNLPIKKRKLLLTTSLRIALPQSFSFYQNIVGHVAISPLKNGNPSLPRHWKSPSPIIIVYQNTRRRCGNLIRKSEPLPTTSLRIAFPNHHRLPNHFQAMWQSPH